MSQWSSPKAKRVLAALLRIGWSMAKASRNLSAFHSPPHEPVVVT